MNKLLIIAKRDYIESVKTKAFLFGLIVAPILIFPGVLLCLLGWGIFLGVPMIMLGILAPLAGPVFGIGEHLGKCPACGTRVVGVTDGKGHSCPVCNAVFDIEHNAAKAS